MINRAVQSGRLNPPRRSLKGFSLVELMVGMAIALMASLAIFQTFAASEEQRRTTGSGSEGLQGGTLAMAQVQAAVRNAGYGLVNPTNDAASRPGRGVTAGVGATILNPDPVATEFLMGCVIPSPLVPIVGGMRVAPVMVRAGATAMDSDVITLMEGSNQATPLPSKLVTASLAGSTSLTLSTTYGYGTNDWVIIYEQSASPLLNANPGTNRNVPCTLARVTGLPSAPLISGGVITLSVGTVAAYSESARVVNLGQAPLFQELRVDAVNRRLVLRNTRNNVEQVLADDVMTMKVQVGLDISADDIIDSWVNPPAVNGDWINPDASPTVPSIALLPAPIAPRSINQIKALRIGLLLRSPQFERPNASGQCDSTGAGPFNVLPAVPGSAGTRVPDMPESPAYSLSGNTRCFRYNTVSTIVPLRNIIMSDL